MGTVQAWQTTTDAAARVGEQRSLLRIGGACAILGTILLAAALAAHGDLPADQGAVVALRYIVDSPNWFVVHLGMIAGAVLWVGAFVALAGTLTGGAAAIGRLLTASAIVGGLLVVFNYSVDGFSFGVVADDWASASSAAERANLELVLAAMLSLLYGTFISESALFYGLTFLLAGLAVARDGRYPRWFGAVGAVAGGAVLANGMASLARVSQTPDWLVFAVLLPLAGLWLSTLGVLMWQRAGWLRASPGQVAGALPRGV